MLRSEDYEANFKEESGVPKEELRAQQQEQENGEKEPVPAQNEQYRNFIVRYNQNINGLIDYESDRTFQIINERFGIIYAPAQQVSELEFTSYTYSSIPKCYTLMDLGGLSASGVTRLHDHPYLKLRGGGQ